MLSIKKNSVLNKNIFFSFFQYILSGFYPLIIILFISTRLSVETWGELTIIQASSILVSLLIIFGTDSLGMRKIPKSGSNSIEIFKSIKQVYFIRLINFLAISIVSYIFIMPYYGTINTLAVLLWAFSIIISPLWAYIALGRTKKFINTELFVRIVSLVMLYIFINEDSDKYLHIIIICSSNLIFSIITTINLVKNLYVKDLSLHNIDLIKSGYRESLPFVSIQLLNHSYIMLPVLLVGSILGSAEAANYGNAEKFQRLFRSFISPLGRVLLTYNSKKDIDKSEIIKQWPYSALFGIILFFVGVIVSTTFFDYFFSNDYRDMKQISIIMFASLPFIFTSSHLINSFLYPEGKEIILRKMLLFIAPITILLLIYFMSIYGLVFTAIITLIAEIILSISIYSFMKYNLKHK